VKQVSIFAENKKGALHNIVSALSDAGVNIAGFVTNDSAEFGIIRMVTSDVDKAEELLEKTGYLYKVSDVLGVEIEDEPGALNALLEALLHMNINVDYLYISYNRENAKPIMVLQVPSLTEVASSLENQGFHIV
jgi:hypothetical protein